MKTKKKFVFMTFFLGVIGLFISWEQPNSSSESYTNESGFEVTASLPSFSAGDIYKLADEGIAEYLSFSKSTGGTYYVYENGSLLSDSTKPFKYDKATGKISIGSTNYLIKFNDVIYTTLLGYFSSSSGSGLYRSWTLENATLILKSDGSIFCSGSGFEPMTGTFTVKKLNCYN